MHKRNIFSFVFDLVLCNDRKFLMHKNANIEGGSPGLVVMGMDSCSKGCKFESCHHILNGHF